MQIPETSQPSWLNPLSVIGVSRSTEWLQQPLNRPSQKRELDDSSEQEGRRVRTRPCRNSLGLAQLPEALKSRLTPYLTFFEATMLSMVTQQFRLNIGNRPLFESILTRLKVTRIPFLTCAARVQATLSNNDPVCMSFLARSIYQSAFDRKTRAYVRSLLNRSIQPSTPDSLHQRLVSDRMNMLWDLHLDGQAPMAESDEQLWDYACRTTRFETESAAYRSQELAKRKFRNLLCSAIWGFCTWDQITAAKVRCVATLALPDLSPEFRDNLVTSGDLLSYFLATTPDAKATAWEACKGSSKKSSSLFHLVATQRYLAHRTSNTHANDQKIANQLIVIIKKSSLYYNKALAIIALASLRLEDRTNVISDADAADDLRSVCSRTCLRPEILQAASLLLGSLYASRRISYIRHSDVEIAVIASRSINAEPMGHGLASTGHFAKDILVRLTLEGHVPLITTGMVALYARDLAVLIPSQKSFYSYADAFSTVHLLGKLGLIGIHDARPSKQIDCETIQSLFSLLAAETDPESCINIQLLIARMYAENRGYKKDIPAHGSTLVQVLDIIRNSAHGSHRRIEATLIGAKLTLNDLHNLPRLQSSTLVEYLRAICTLPMATPSQVHQARLLLASFYKEVALHRQDLEKIFGENGCIPLVSHVDAQRFCLEILEDTHAQQEIKRVAFDMLASFKES